MLHILESMNKIFQRYFLDNPVFKLLAIHKYINKILTNKTTSKKSFFKVGTVVQNLSTESSKNTCQEICILENSSVSMTKICDNTNILNVNIVINSNIYQISPKKWPKGPLKASFCILQCNNFIPLLE